MGNPPTPPAAHAGPPRWREVFRGRRGRLTAGLLLLEALVAVQILVVATILPDVRRDLGMIQLYGLVFTASGLATLGTIPIAGRALDRYGAERVLPPVLGLFVAGLLVAATAPAMPVVLLGQFLLGAGGGGMYAMSLGTVAKTYPDALRPRVMALLASMWILPGLIGPPLGAAIAATVGWRWAFLAPLPVLVLAWVLIAPALGLVPPPEREPDALSVRWPLQLMAGGGLTFTALAIVRPWSLGLLASGLAIGIPALRRIVPPGTFRASPGTPAAALSAFLLSVGFLTMDAFLTLVLTQVRGVSLGEASVAITAATLTWAAGSAWQSGRAERLSLHRLLRIGTAAVLLGEAAVALALSPNVPLAVAYLGWAVVGAGMGVAFPTVPLAAMRRAEKGQESSDVSAVLLMDVLGVSTGAGLGGGAIAVSRALAVPITRGLIASFAMGWVALAALLVVAGRIGARGPAATGSPGEVEAR